MYAPGTSTKVIASERRPSSQVKRKESLERSKLTALIVYWTSMHFLKQKPINLHLSGN
jgi:hypothetical protein